MPFASTETITQPIVGESSGIDPLVSVEHLIQWTAGTALHLALGLPLGLLAAHLMRRRHLHWSWGAVGLLCTLLLRAPLGASATTLAAGALVATTHSRRWHREDLLAGADLAQIARDRCHPLDLARAGAHRVVRPARHSRGEELILGRERHGRPVAIALGGERGGTHTLVLGATGSGKTVTQALIARHAIARGMAAVIVDPKGDRALRESARRAARTAGRRFVEWTPAGPSVYNPCARGSETEIADRVLAAERYSEPHYQRQAQRYLGHAVRALQYTGAEVTLAGLVRALDPAQLELLARTLPPEHGLAVHQYLDSLEPRQRRDLGGVRDRLAVIAESDVGRWLDPALGPAAVQRFDLLEAIQERAVIYFSLRADSRPLLAQMLGAAIVGDLQSAISTLQSGSVPALVLIDEFLGAGRRAARGSLRAGAFGRGQPVARHPRSYPIYGCRGRSDCSSRFSAISRTSSSTARSSPTRPS